MTEKRRNKVQSLSKEVTAIKSGNKRKDTKTKNVRFSTDDYEELAMQYDEQAKNALGYKSILAFILAKAVDEFSEMETKDIIDLIEDVYIGKVPVDPGHTNVRKGERIYGLNTENSERNEGLIRYDILFKVRTSKNAEDAYVIIVNIEMQKEEPKGYNLVNRAIYYACRLISSEKQREFVKMNFNDIVKVYSIWIVANMEDNSVNRIHFTKDTLYGSYKWNCDTDLINIIIIGITGQPDVIENKVSKENLKSLELCKI